MNNKPGRRVFREIRRRRLDFARRGWKYLAGGCASIGVPAGGVIAILYVAEQTAVASFLLGVLLMGLIALCGYFLLLEGSFNRRMGGVAEEWTAQAFNKLPKDSWSVFHNVELERFDIDHVVIGPEKILAVETKWTGQPLPQSNGRPVLPRSWIEQAHRAANKTRLLLKAHGFEGRVDPILVVWGISPPAENGYFTHKGVQVLVGGAERTWLQKVVARPWSSKPTDGARIALQRYLDRQRAAR